MKIFFRSKDELMYFKQLLTTDEIITKEIKQNRQGFQLTISAIPITILIKYFIKIYIVFRLRRKIEEITSNTYFYSNETEIEQIFEWTHFLLHDKTFMKEHFNEETLCSYLHNLFIRQFTYIRTTEEVYFDTVILFQLKQFHEQLIDIVGLAIDEIKREEEYQSYIENIRSYIKNKKHKCSVLHVLQGKPFKLYSNKGKKYLPDELYSLMIKEPLYVIGLDENEENLSPILTLLPEKLIIYGHDIDDSRVLMLMNLFQERALFLPVKMFPFKST